MRTSTVVAGIGVFALLCALGVGPVVGSDLRRAEPARTEEPGAFAPSRFVLEENLGQTDPRVAFVVRQPGFTALLSAAEVTLAGRSDAACDVVRMSFRDAAPGATMRGRRPTGGFSSYFRGSATVTGARHFSEAVTCGLRDGIDLRWRGDQDRRLAFDLVVSPGADPAEIEFDVEGATGLRVGEDGALRISTPHGEFAQTQPVAWQEAPSGRVAVDAAFVLRGERRIGFDIAAHDPAAPLVIDPVIEWASSVGGSLNDRPEGIAVDAAGSAYVTGQTYSPDIPADADIDGALGGTADAFVVKLTPDGSAIEWSAYLGSSGWDEGEDIALNSLGEAFVSGSAGSADFPRVAAPGTTLDGQPDFPGAFVAKIAADGRSLAFSRSLAGSSGNSSMALDPAGDVYVAGNSHGEGPAATPGVLQSEVMSTTGGWVVKLDGATSEIRYATYLGGAGGALPRRIAVDASGSAYVGGSVYVPADFPATARLAPSSDRREAFVARLAPDASSLVFAVTFGAESVNGMAIAPGGGVVLTGDEDRDDFPLTHLLRGMKHTRAGAYVAKIAPEGELEYATVVGGLEFSPVDAPGAGATGYDVVVDAAGAPILIGYASPGFGPPFAGYDHRVTGTFLARLTPDARALTYAVRAGITSSSPRVALGPGDSVYVTSQAWSGRLANASPRSLDGMGRRGSDFIVARFAPQNARMSLLSGNAWDGPGFRDRVQCAVRHPFAEPGRRFDPHVRDVTVAIGAGQTVRTVEIPARHSGWRQVEDGWEWQSPRDARPNWRVTFNGRSTALIVLRYADLDAPMDNPFTVDLGVGDARASAFEHWPRVPGPGPAHHRFR